MNDARPLNYEFYKARLDLFVPGMAEHITPIAFEVITPDMSMLSFSTFGQDGSQYYFVLLQYDYMFSIKHATKVINKQFAKVIEYLPPVSKQKGRTELEQKSATFPERGYHVLLARTERPKGNGYWASCIQVMPGDDIHKTLDELSPADKQAAQKLIQEILQKNPPTSAASSVDDFLSSWTAKQNRSHATIRDLKINDTNLAINIFKNALGNWEGFYNYIDGGTPNKNIVK